MATSEAPRAGRRPEWLKVRLTTGETYRKVRGMMSGLELNTVCQEARCPNIYECWNAGTATFMILGDTCTRACGFCAVTTGRPRPGVDPAEPMHVAQAVQRLGIRHCVITSVDRDDLADGGARHFHQTIRAVYELNPECDVEILTPDFRGVDDALDVILPARPKVFSHNVETVPELYPSARRGSSYERSLELLRLAAHYPVPGLVELVKTGLMIGLGETREQLRSTLRDIRSTGVEIVTIGQYLQPTSDHMPVDRFVPPEEFDEIRAEGLEIGFSHVEAGPLVRSSYHAEQHLPGKSSPTE